MKNRIISGAVTITLGLLIALGPQFLFKVCATTGHGFLRCHWSAQGEIGIGALIATLGIALLIFVESHVRLGLTIGVGFSSVIALCIPMRLSEVAAWRAWRAAGSRSQRLPLSAL